MQKTSLSVPVTLISLTVALLYTGCATPRPQTTKVSEDPAGRLTLVDRGTSVAPIVLFEGAPPFTRRAADELAEVIEKMSGARPEVFEGAPDPLPEHAIWVGYQPVLDDLFPGMDFDFKHPEEIVLAANEDHVVVAGRDRWNPDHLEIKDKRGRPIVGIQIEYGTINAVYTFLQDVLDVRWLWPGELGEDVPRHTTIALAPFETRYHPQIRYRQGVFGFSTLGNVGYGRSYDWSRKQRLLLGSLGYGGSHAFRTWWDRFHETHPEYFALQPDGTRTLTGSPRCAKMCQSNPGVWSQWIAEVEAQLEENPNQRVFNAAANDGWASGHCICEQCRAWDHPQGEKRMFRWKGLGQAYPALSDRHVTLANNCARLLKERYPDQDYYVSTLAYGHSRPAPIEAVPDDNVIVASVANFILRRGLKDRGSPNGTTHREQFEAWGRVAPHLMWRPNTGSPAGWQQGLPDVPITETIEDFKFIASLHCVGISIDSVWEHWATQGPLYYVMAQLTWDPSQDGQAVLEDYYERGFGPAAGPVAAYWALLEATRAAYKAGEAAYPQVYNDAFFDQAYALLDQGAAKAAAGPDVFAKRLDFVRAGLDYTRLVVENRRLMAQYKASGKNDAGAADAVRANWEKIRAISQTYPYAINWGPLRPQTGRMKGLHPDYL